MTEQASDSPGKPRKPPPFTAEDYRREAESIRCDPENDNGPYTLKGWMRLADMLDAAAELAQPKTCATCRWWMRHGESPHGECKHVDAPAYFFIPTDADFCCALWTQRADTDTPPPSVG